MAKLNKIEQSKYFIGSVSFPGTSVHVNKNTANIALTHLYLVLLSVLRDLQAHRKIQTVVQNALCFAGVYSFHPHS